MCSYQFHIKLIHTFGMTVLVVKTLSVISDIMGRADKSATEEMIKRNRGTDP